MTQVQALAPDLPGTLLAADWSKRPSKRAVWVAKHSVMISDRDLAAQGIVQKDVPGLVSNAAKNFVGKHFDPGTF